MPFGEKVDSATSNESRHHHKHPRKMLRHSDMLPTISVSASEGIESETQIAGPNIRWMLT